MIPQITGGITQQIKIIHQPSKTYADLTYEISGYVDKLDALKQTILHILSTERYAYPIYNDNYGIELEKYLGNSFNYLEATIENTLRDALLQDDRITEVMVTKINKESIDSALIIFDVYTNIGILEMDVFINV